jgi:hypothetical protein
VQAFSAKWQTTMNLKDKVLRREENQFDQDYSKGSCYYEKSQRLILYGNFAFHFEQKVLASVSGNKPGLPSERHQINTGRWAVEMRQGRTALVLNNSDGSEFTWWYIEDGGSGVQYLDGKAWNRSSIHETLKGSQLASI